MSRDDDLSREVTLCLGPDKTLTIGPVYGQQKTHTADWRSPVIDALFEGDVDTAYRMLRDYKSEPIEPEVDMDDRDCYTLPVFSVDTVVEARILQERLGVLVAPQHPIDPDQPWYVLALEGFGKEIDISDFPAIASTFRAAYARLKKGPHVSRSSVARRRGNARRSTP